MYFGNRNENSFIYRLNSLLFCAPHKSIIIYECNLISKFLILWIKYNAEGYGTYTFKHNKNNYFYLIARDTVYKFVCYKDP